MFRDTDGSELAVGDSVTVERSSRQRFTSGSHGRIEKFGTKLVHVRITTGRSERDDNALMTFDPHELRKGLHGRPRHPGGRWAEMQEIVADFRNEQVDRLLSVSVERGVISDEQADAMRQLASELS